MLQLVINLRLLIVSEKKKYMYYHSGISSYYFNYQSGSRAHCYARSRWILNVKEDLRRDPQ